MVHKPLLTLHLPQVDDYYILNRSDTPPSRAMLVLSRADKKCHGMKLLNPSFAASLTREELAVLKNLRHPNVLKYREFLQCKNKDGIYAVFDFVPRGVVVSGYKLESNKAIPEVGHGSHPTAQGSGTTRVDRLVETGLGGKLGLWVAAAG